MSVKRISGSLSLLGGISGNVSDPNRISGGSYVPEKEVLPTYSGPYTVTPTQSQQVLSTENMKMSQNVVVEPIPSNYGLITWNGSTLTVS